MSIETLVAALESCTLPPAEFSHRNHVQAAWHYLHELPLPQAAQRFCGVLQVYVRHVGAVDKFHITLTQAFMHLIHIRMNTGEDWESFELRNPELFKGGLSLVARHYSPEVLEQGRGCFVEPDREALP